MSFVSYPHLRLLISGQTFEITIGLKFFWNFKGIKRGLTEQAGLNSVLFLSCLLGKKREREHERFVFTVDQLLTIRTTDQRIVKAFNGQEQILYNNRGN